MIEFRVLGSLEVVEADRPLALGSPRQRALLAVLLVHRGETISSDRLIDELWGERAPASAIKIVQGYVSNLRKVLGDGLLVTRGRGYLLQIEPGQLDVDRFESLVTEGRRALRNGDPRTAVARLRGALGLWRGPPLADFAYESFAQPEIARLEELRLAALEERIDAELALGEHQQLVGELDGLVREHPLRERLIAQLMLALYRSGRQADALESYRLARGRLVQELGLEPGRELQERQRAILAQDPVLEPALGTTASPARGATASPGRVRARRRRWGGLGIAAGAAALLALLVVVAVRLSGSAASTVRAAPNSLAAIDTGNNQIVGGVTVGSRPGAVTFGSGSLWVTNLDDQTVSRIDPTTLHTLRVIPVAGTPMGIAASGGRIWVIESHQNPGPGQATSSVLAVPVDPGFDQPGTGVPIANVDPTGPAAIAAQGGSVWVAPSAGLLTRLDATTGRKVRHLDPNASPAGIAIGEGAIWLSDTEANNVVRVDPTGLLTPIPVGHAPTRITVGAGSVWVVDSLDDAVVRIDPTAGSPTARIPVGQSPAGIAFGAGSVWVANSGDGTVTRIDPHTDKVQATITVGGSPQALTVAAGRVWVAVDARSIAPPQGGSGGTTLRMTSSSDVSSLDPAVPGGALAEPLLYATCAQLVNYPDKSGPAGSQLTAEVAQSLPTRSADGRTYTFTIRRGFSFSPPSHQPVTAQTFKYSIERTLSPTIHSWVAPSLGDIVGARAYIAGKASHIAGVVARADKLTIRLLAPAPDFLARLALPAFCAVPTNTPVSTNVHRIPSAGPYYVTSDTPGQGIVLTRNPNYRGSRPAHFARIEVAGGIPPQRAAAEIQAGTADYTPLGLETNSTTVAGLASRLAARYGPGSVAAARGRQQYFITPGLQLDYFILNTHRALFSDVRMRRAVNYAIDRRALARLGDAFQPLPERPTDHYLPPVMPGFRDAQVYPMTPDVAKARTLAHGRSRGRTAVLYTCDSYPCPQQAQIITTDLAAIDLKVQVKVLPSAKLFDRARTSGESFDLAWEGWVPDYLDPQAMLTSILEDRSVSPTFDDRRSQRDLVKAARLSGPERYLTYGKLDLDLARNSAPLAAFGNLPNNDFFSARIGCQTYGIYGIDFAALCLKSSRR